MKSMLRKALTKTVRLRKRDVELPPSERLVYGMYFSIAALLGLVVLEVTHMVYLDSWNSEIFAAITSIIGAILGIFISQRA